MKILQVVDIPDWIIGKLAKTIQDENPHLNIEILSIHPKDLRNNPEQYCKQFEDKVDSFNPDVIHFHYWDTCNTLSKLGCCKHKTTILTHHNQCNLTTHKWEVDHLVVHTEKAKSILQKEGYWNVEIIQHGLDVKYHEFKEKYDVKNNVIGYIGRVCRWKGLKEIAKLARELKTKVICLGRIDDGAYWNELQEYKDVLDIRFGTPDEKKIDVIHEFGIYIGNSRDGREEGTLGFLEAMSCGIPVVTTRAGEANDIIEDGKNGILVDFENYDSLKNGVKKMMASDKNKIRNNAWNTIRKMDKKVMARKYERLYYKAFDKDLVSVIIPTCNRANNIIKVIEAYNNQTYQPLELIICDDFSEDDTKNKIFSYAEKNKNIPIKYERTNNKGYGLAEARNRGIFLASGNYIVCSDDRMVPEPQAVEAFINNLKKRKGPSAIWGDKGAGKRDFIENFFAIRKKHIVVAGMFNERINKYGAMSQEFRWRLRNQGVSLQYEPMARCNPEFGTHHRSNKRYELLEMKTKLWLLDN